MTGLLTRRIFKYFLNMNYITIPVCEHSEYPGLTVNPNAPFCFSCMGYLDFLSFKG